MKTLFVLSNVVVGIGIAGQAGAVISSTITGTIEYVVDDSVRVDIGWKCEIIDGSPVLTEIRTISADDVRKGLILAERVKWDSGKPDEMVTAKLEFQSPRLVGEAAEVLNFLVDAGVISSASRSKILA